MASFMEKLRQGYRGYTGTCSKTASGSSSFLDALVEQKEVPPQRCFQGVAEAVSRAQRCAAPAEQLRVLAHVGESQRLNLALTYYHDEAQREKLEAELTNVVSQAAQEMPKGDVESLDLVLKADLEVFAQWCVEVGELYIYFSFLDLKGDRSLLMLVAKRLQSLLGAASISSLVANLKKTRSWAEKAWQMMAQQQESALLERLHSKTLLQWLVLAKDTVQVSVAEHGLKPFWDSCFSGLQRVPWHDFVDSLQEQFLKGFCPKDLLEPLHRRVAKKSQHHVTRQHWELLLETYDHSITNLLDVLTEEVLEGISSRVYRGTRGTRGTVLQDAGPQSRDSSKGRKAKRDSSARAATGPRPGLRHISPTGSPRRKLAAESCFGQEIDRIEGSHTPEDPRLHMRPVEAGRKIEWSAYVEELCRSEMRWWTEAEGLSQNEDQLRLSALRAVNSQLICSRKALVLRVASGELANSRPVLDFGGEGQLQQLPAVLISPNDITMSPAVTKFGRGSKRKMLPDMFMNEPIASRSHFSISFDAQKQRYELMDAGSKWGTFVKVGCGGLDLSCGDWIRIGNAELVIRYCGGCCKSKRHMVSQQRSLHSALTSFPGLQPSKLYDEDSQDEINSHCASLLSGRARPWWTNAVDTMCQHSALQSAKTRMNPMAIHTAPAPLPWAPIELDFVSGPRMGERLVITERHCTIGRADSCTIQISDPMLANVSRTHCIIQNTGRGARIMDNNSTNGTWKRLSCVLEPSDPQELKTGSCILAGVHEFRVEEAEMCRDWIPSVAGRTLQQAVETTQPISTKEK